MLVGVPTPDMQLELPLIDVFGRGGSLKSSWYGDCLPSRDFPMLVDLYLQGRLDLDAFVTETIGLDDVEEAFDKMHAGEVLRSVVELYQRRAVRPVTPSGWRPHRPHDDRGHLQPRRRARGTSTTTSGSSATTPRCVVIDAPHDADPILELVGDRPP